MADVKICDRCGKKIEDKIWPITITAYRSKFRLEDEERIYKWDLCKDCTQKVRKFIDSKED